MISFQFVADNFDELEADFQREYGIDLREALYGDNPVGGRRLTALINGLSPGSATMRRINSGGKQWGQMEELLAVLCELIDLNNRMYYTANFDTKKDPVWDPIEIPRPRDEDVTPKSKTSDTEEVLSFFGTMAAGAGDVFVDNPEQAAVSSTSEESD